MLINSIFLYSVILLLMGMVRTNILGQEEKDKSINQTIAPNKNNQISEDNLTFFNIINQSNGTASSTVEKSFDSIIELDDFYKRKFLQ